MTVTTLTGSGSWTCPAGVRYVDVVLKGGGGGGATGASSNTGAGGGGLEGSTTTLTKQAVTPGTSYAYSVGAGGDGHDVDGGPSIPGGNGNSSSMFGTSANGGVGGGSIAGSIAQEGQGTGGGAAGAGTYYTGLGTHTSGANGTNGTGGGGGGTGTYNSTLVGTPSIHSGDGGNGTITITYVLPTVAFHGHGTGSSDPPTGAKPMTVAWTNETTNGVSYSWTFTGAGTTSQTVQNPVDSVYSASGNYDVTLAVTNAYGDVTLVKSGYVTVYGIPFNRAVIIMADRHRGR